MSVDDMVDVRSVDGAVMPDICSEQAWNGTHSGAHRATPADSHRAPSSGTLRKTAESTTRRPPGCGHGVRPPGCGHRGAATGCGHGCGHRGAATGVRPRGAATGCGHGVRPLGGGGLQNNIRKKKRTDRPLRTVSVLGDCGIWEVVEEFLNWNASTEQLNGFVDPVHGDPREQEIWAQGE